MTIAIDGSAYLRENYTPRPDTTNKLPYSWYTVWDEDPEKKSMFRKVVDDAGCDGAPEITADSCGKSWKFSGCSGTEVRVLSGGSHPDSERVAPISQRALFHRFCPDKSAALCPAGSRCPDGMRCLANRRRGAGQIGRCTAGGGGTCRLKACHPVAPRSP